MAVLLRPFTILHTIETSGPGGAETVILELASSLDRSRFRSIVLLPPGHWLPQALREREVRTIEAKSSAWYDPHVFRVMVGLIVKEKVDLIHSHLPDQNFYSCIAGVLTRRKTIVTYHGAQPFTGGGGARRAFKTWVVQRTASSVVVVSDYLKNLLAEAGFKRERLVRIYNGVNLSRFAGPPRGCLRTELHCPPECRLIGMVANMRQSKGYEYFVKAARIVKDSFPQAHFVVVGELEGRIVNQMRALMKDLNLEDHFSLLGFRGDVPQILADLDVFVLSSVSEGLSIATIEAMAAGRPVVVTRSGGPQEIIEDRRTGLLVPPGDASALASGICEVLASSELASALGRNAQMLVEGKFSLKNMISSYESLYERCLLS